MSAVLITSGVTDIPNTPVKLSSNAISRQSCRGLNLTNFASVKLPAPAHGTAPSSQQQHDVTCWLISYVELQSSLLACNSPTIYWSFHELLLTKGAKIKYNILPLKRLHQQCLIVDILYQINVLIKTSWTNFQTTLNIKTFNWIKIKIHYDTSLNRKG